MASTSTRTDIQIERDVESELNWDAQMKPNEIGVTVKDGVVTLYGEVNSFPRKWVAQDVARRVTGVTAVVNNLTVRLPAEHQRTDSDIEAAAVNALDWDTWIPVERLRVSVVDGWIDLSGEVDWQWQKKQAEDTVRRLWGIRGVTNRIAIRALATPSATVTKREIEDALVRDAQTHAQGIAVEVDGHTVILTGKVRTWAECDAAEKAAYSAPGVSHVDNRLTIASY